jgi:hypothetical protein
LCCSSTSCSGGTGARYGLANYEREDNILYNVDFESLMEQVEEYYVGRANLGVTFVPTRFPEAGFGTLLPCFSMDHLRKAATSRRREVLKQHHEEYEGFMLVGAVKNKHD